MLNNQLDTLEFQKQLGFNLQTISESLGVISVVTKDHETRLKTLEEADKTKDGKFKEFEEKLNDQKIVDDEQQQAFKNSIHNRVGDLLRSRDRFDLFGSFARQCWSECKSYSKMRGTSGIRTKQIYFNEVLNFIGNWEPMKYGGTDGYINHLDSKKEG